MSQTLILDTNVWLDWLVYQDTCVDRLKALHEEGQLTLVATARMRDELADVLQRAFLVPVLERKQLKLEQLLAQYDSLVRVHEAPEPCPQLRCRDHDDQMFLDLAAHLKVHALLSKDKLVLKLAKPARKWFGILITRPDMFLTPQ
jgi:uncharacterized protein